ncbi:MAG: hypothetical protein ACOCRO_07115, partial [Halanaerobiales bacterium]
QKVYDTLIELGFIEAEESLSLSVSDFSGGSETVKNRLEANKIQGFIQDEFMAAEYIPVESKTGETLKIKKDDALYLLLTGKKPQKLKEDIYVIPYHQRGEYNLGLEKTEDDIYQINSRILPGVAILGQEPSPLLIEDKEELAQGQMLINLMKMIYKMQRSYIDKRKELFSFIYPTKDGVRVAKSVPPSEQLPEDLQASHNEYIFMPYIEKDGNINEINPQLRDEYVASVFKSMLQKKKEIDKYTNYNSIRQFDDGVQTVKYGLEDYKNKYWHDFVGIIPNIFDRKLDIDQKFVEILKTVKCSELREFYGQYQRTFYFNYYKMVLEQIEENPQSLEDFYQIEKVGNYQQSEVIEHPRSKKATHVITIDPDYKSKLEYKYNPDDHIIGGDLKLYLKVEEETKDDVTEKVTTTPKTKKKVTKEQKKMLAERQKKIIAAQKTEPSPKFKKNKKLITNLNKTSSTNEIKQAAEVVISEARRKKKEVIAESIEDYLSGMYNQKKVNDKKLRVLDAVKTAEIELKLEINRNLIWELNDILYSTQRFKPYEEVTFGFKESRLVDPIVRTIEEFINTSKKSILKAEANFVLEKVPNRKKLKLKGKLSYRWENNYRWLVGRKKLLPGYGYIDDYLFKKLAAEKVAKPYKMYSEWDYYLTDSISLLKDEVDSLRDWLWDDFAMFEMI